MTSDERHEVAARLRDDNHGYGTEYDFFLHALGMSREGRGPCDWAKVHKRLADLINPTCRVVPFDEESMRLPRCSRCGQPMLKPWPNFCPNCGARVTSGGE